MQREFGVIYAENESLGSVPGDEAAVAIALGLAQRCDAQTLIALSDSVAMLERVGGQFHIVAVRRENEEGSGEFETFGLAFRHESRDARLKVAKPPETALGIPVSDASVPTEDLPEVDVEPEGEPAAAEAA